MVVTGNYVFDRHARSKAATTAFAHVLRFRDDRIASLEQITDTARWGRVAAAEDLAVVLRMFEAIESRDGEALFATYAEDTTITEAHSLPYGGVYHRQAGAAEHAARYLATWDPVQTPEDHLVDPVIVSAGQRGFAIWHQRASSPAGRRLDQPVIDVIEVQNGKVSSLSMFQQDTAAALEFLNASGAGPSEAGARLRRLKHAEGGVMTFYEQLVAAGREHEESVVVVERGEDRAIVTLADPDKLNVLSAPLCLQLKAALQQLVDDGAIKAVVLTGADPGFSAGGDLRMMDQAPQALAGPEGSTDIWRWIRYQFGAIARLIARSDTAFIAALNGPAAGVGLAWALTCDLVIASHRARIVPAFGRLGLLPEVGTSWAITRRLGYQGAFAYYAAGEHLDAQRALELGLVHEVVAHEELRAAADGWCDKIAALPPHTISMTKPLLRAASDASWEQALVMEEFAEPQCFTTEAFQSAVKQMLAKM